MYQPILSALTTVSLLLTSALTAQAWTKLTPTGSPSARNYHAMCTDTGRSVTVVFSGSSNAADTWEFNGSSWKRITSTVTPPILWYAGMSYDSKRKVCVLFGGRNSSGRLNETWEWNGTNWKRILTQASPAIRYGHAQCFDSFRNVTVVFSGNNAGYYNDTWEYDGTNWKQVATTGPTGRIYSRMAFDFTRGKSVLFSGYAARAQPSADVQDTWEWDGKAWTEIKLPVQPLARWGHDMCYVLGRGVVMFGGQKQLTPNQGAKNDTWLYNGKGWAEVKPATPPTARRLHAMSTHPTNILQAVLFGGSVGGAETHALDLGRFAPGIYTPYGTSCVGSNGSPTLGANGTDAPYINSTFTARLTNIPSGAPAFLIFGLSNTKWGAVNLPMDWSFFGFPGCKLQADLLTFFPMLTAGAAATLPVPVPNDSTLVGVTYYNQAFVADGAGATLSNGAEATIGRR